MTNPFRPFPPRFHDDPAAAGAHPSVQSANFVEDLLNNIRYAYDGDVMSPSPTPGAQFGIIEVISRVFGFPLRGVAGIDRDILEAFTPTVTAEQRQAKERLEFPSSPRLNREMLRIQNEILVNTQRLRNEGHEHQVQQILEAMRSGGFFGQAERIRLLPEVGVIPDLTPSFEILRR